MKKIAFLAAAALCCPLAMAQEEAPVTPAVVCTPEAAEAMVDEVLAALNEAVEILESVQDQATAEAAVPRMEAVMQRMVKAQADMEALGEPDEATQEKLAQKLLPALFELAPRMEAAGQRIIENDFYGCEALENVLQNL